ncbi:MAG TPA: ATP synthase F1 subunit delta [Myxococcota bacterium]|jgi:F-type H+-transporting ATPase subunit delta|nr:ATP synthase F1 subunit delta [Myxococcota bacterium]
MPKSAAARRYAKALFSLARDEGRIDGVLSEVGALAGLLEGSAELRNVLFRPLHPVAQRKAVLADLAERGKISPTLRKFLALLLEHRRMGLFFEVRAELERLANEAAGRLEAEVVAASELVPDQLERLRRALSARTQRDVQLRVRIDPSIVGGVVAKVGDLVFDGSLRTQLGQLRATLMKGR